MMLTVLVFLSGFLLSATAAYYSVVGLIAIFPGAVVAIVAMGATLEIAKLVTASWLYRNWKVAPVALKSYMTAAVLLLMFITSMGIFGFLSKSHLDHALVSTSDVQFQVQTADDIIASREKNISLIERQINNIDQSLSTYINSGEVTKGLQQKRKLDGERKQLEAQRQEVEEELLLVKAKRNKLTVEIKKQEADVGPLKYIAELIYGNNAKDHFDSTVRIVIILLILVFDPLAVILLIAGNVSLIAKEPPKVLDIKPKRKYTRRKPLVKPEDPVHVIKPETFGIEHAEEPTQWQPSVLRKKP